VALPNHLTPMTVVAGERTLAPGAQEISVRFETVDAGGSKLAKTYTFKRGEYTIGVKHEFSKRAAAAVKPQLYLQLRGTATARRRVELLFHLHRSRGLPPTPASSRRSTSRHRQGGTSHASSRNDGWVAMVQHYFASAWLAPVAGPRVRTPSGRQPLHGGHGAAAGRGGAGATTTHDATLFAGPGKEQARALAPGLNW